MFTDIQFFDIAQHFVPFFKKTLKSKGESFAVTKYNRFMYTKGSNSVQVSQTSGSNVWTSFHLLKGDYSFTQPDMPKPDLPTNRIYNGIISVPIKRDKLNDIKQLYSYLTPNEVEFYNYIKEKVLEPGLTNQEDALE